MSRYYAKVTLKVGMFLISAYNVDLFWKLWSLKKCDKGIDINPEDETFYNTQYQQVLLKYVDNEYFAIHRQFPSMKHETVLRNNLLFSVIASTACQASSEQYHLPITDE